MVKSPPHIWVISDGTKGMEVQALGLAEQLSPAPQLIRTGPLPSLSRHFPSLARQGLCPMPKALRQALNAPNVPDSTPDIVITCGRRHAGLSLMMRRFGNNSDRGRIKTIHIQNPHLPSEYFDWLIVPSHDDLRGDNVLVSLGSLNRLDTLMRQNPPPPKAVKALEGRKIAVLIGGSNRRYRVQAQDYHRFGTSLADIASMTESALLLIPSRRANCEAQEAMRAPLANTPHWWWDGTEPNPYPWILRQADAVIVTADSVNMTSEAVSSGKPVHTAELRPESGRIARFHKIMQEAGYTKPLTRIALHNFFDSPSNPPPPLDETTRIANILREKLEK